MNETVYLISLLRFLKCSPLSDTTTSQFTRCTFMLEKQQMFNSFLHINFIHQFGIIVLHKDTI